MSTRIFLFLFFTPFLWRGVGGEVFCQDSIPPRKPEHRVELVAEGFVASSTITNNFIKAFYYGDFIDDLLKENAAAKLSPVNRLGAASRLGFTYVFHSFEGKNNPEVSISFFDRTNTSLKFPEDLFNTVFYGNKMFAGTTAGLGNFKFNFLRYQQLRFGWDWKGVGQTRGSYGFAASLLSGDRNAYVNALFANLFTAPDGTFMDLYLKMNVSQTDTTHTNFFAQNGLGLSTDFYYELPYIAWKNPGKITLEVRDMGFIRWNSNSMYHSVDSSFHYEGVNVDDVFNLDSASLSPNIDQALDKNTAFERKAYTTNIPCTFDLHTKVLYGKQIIFEKGITWFFNTSARPYYYARLHFLFGRKKSLDLGYVVGYGGYGRFNAGLDAKIDFARHYSLHFVDNYLFSGILARSAYGMGAYLKLVRRF